MPDAAGAGGGTLRFRVQKHDASRLHYDLRLELGGVLRSWALPRGPSRDPGQRRLAVGVPDHALSYADFEGVIPPGRYGAGTVMLWDRGTWEPEGDARAGLDAGRLRFRLYGERMRGRWMLTRMRPGSGKGETWLLRKLDDAEAGGADDLTKTYGTSVSSGRSMAGIAAAHAAPSRSVASRSREPGTSSADSGMDDLFGDGD